MPDQSGSPAMTDRVRTSVPNAFGCTPMRLLAEIRMQHAHLALTGQAPVPATIAEAARLAGINRVSRFKVAYRSRYGAAPGIVAPQGSSRAAAGPAPGPQGVQPGRVPAVPTRQPAVPRRGMRRQGVLTESGNGQAPRHWYREPAMNKPLACLVVGYGCYAVTDVVSRNCPEGRRKPGRLARLRDGSDGFHVRPLVLP